MLGFPFFYSSFRCLWVFFFCSLLLFLLFLIFFLPPPASLWFLPAFFYISFSWSCCFLFFFCFLLLLFGFLLLFSIFFSAHVTFPFLFVVCSSLCLFFPLSVRLFLLFFSVFGNYPSLPFTSPAALFPEFLFVSADFFGSFFPLL